MIQAEMLTDELKVDLYRAAIFYRSEIADQWAVVTHWHQASILFQAGYLQAGVYG